MTKVAKGEVLGVREEGIRLREFVERKYWPTIKSALSSWEQQRARSILDTQILPTFGGTKLARLRREEIERWQADRLGDVSGSTANKELMRLKHLLNRAVAWGYIKNTPARSVKKSKEAPGRTRDTASTLTMAGVPQRTLMAILGHRDPRMTLRYQHLSPEHLRDAARALDRRPAAETRRASAEA